jgi:hypothetical protein
MQKHIKGLESQSRDVDTIKVTDIMNRAALRAGSYASPDCHPNNFLLFLRHFLRAACESCR